MDNFDLAIIGSGPGGYVCAIRAAQLGLKVCCIEKREKLGGTCLNIGCIPSKSLLHTSHLYRQAKEMQNLGISFSNLSLDIGKMLDAKNKSVTSLTDGIDFLFKKNKIVKKRGFGKLISKNKIEVLFEDSSEIINAQKIVIATGSEASTPGGILIDEINILSSTGALELTSAPKELIVIGAGYIGLELGLSLIHI